MNVVVYSRSLAAPGLQLLIFSLVPVAYFLINVAMLLFVVACKWLLIRRYEEGDHPFYSSYHFRWMTMVALTRTVAPFLAQLRGTAFFSWYYRLMGAEVGRDCCLFSMTTEYDLTKIGDRSALGADCDISAHTVERMVIKLRRVEVGARCSIRDASVVMPGAAMEDGATLLELSQVLKGEIASAESVWAGLPARMVDREAPCPGTSEGRAEDADRDALGGAEEGYAPLRGPTEEEEKREMGSPVGW
jgi:non-ribosomal peptide synthetase-like protein